MSNTKHNSLSSLKEERHLDDIIDSIRSIIKQHDPLKGAIEDNGDDNVNSDIHVNLDDQEIQLNKEILELDKIDCNNNHYDKEFISNETIIKTKSIINKLSDQIKSNKKTTDDVLNNNILQIIQPMIKDWLENNLPQMVEQILKDELKKIIDE